MDGYCSPIRPSDPITPPARRWSTATATATAREGNHCVSLLGWSWRRPVAVSPSWHGSGSGVQCRCRVSWCIRSGRGRAPVASFSGTDSPGARLVVGRDLDGSWGDRRPSSYDVAVPVLLARSRVPLDGRDGTRQRHDVASYAFMHPAGTSGDCQLANTTMLRRLFLVAPRPTAYYKIAGDGRLESAGLF
jgi:hypothetical protein